MIMMTRKKTGGKKRKQQEKIINVKNPEVVEIATMMTMIKKMMNKTKDSVS